MKGYQGQQNFLQQGRLAVFKDGGKKSWIAMRERRYYGKRELVWICFRLSQKETESREPMEGAEKGPEVGEKAPRDEDVKQSRKETATQCQ